MATKGQAAMASYVSASDTRSAVEKAAEGCIKSCRDIGELSINKRAMRAFLSALETLPASLPDKAEELHAETSPVGDSLLAWLTDCLRLLQRLEMQSNLQRAFPVPSELIEMRNLAWQLQYHICCLLVVPTQSSTAQAPNAEASSEPPQQPYSQQQLQWMLATNGISQIQSCAAAAAHIAASQGPCQQALVACLTETTRELDEAADPSLQSPAVDSNGPIAATAPPPHAQVEGTPGDAESQPLLAHSQGPDGRSTPRSRPRSSSSSRTSKSSAWAPGAFFVLICLYVFLVKPLMHSCSLRSEYRDAVAREHAANRFRPVNATITSLVKHTCDSCRAFGTFQLEQDGWLEGTYVYWWRDVPYASDQLASATVRGHLAQYEHLKRALDTGANVTAFATSWPQRMAVLDRTHYVVQGGPWADATSACDIAGSVGGGLAFWAMPVLIGVLAGLAEYIKKRREGSVAMRADDGTQATLPAPDVVIGTA